MSWEATKNEIMKKMIDIQDAIKSSLESSNHSKYSKGRTKSRHIIYDSSSDSSDYEPTTHYKPSYSTKHYINDSDDSDSDISSSSDDFYPSYKSRLSNASRTTSKYTTNSSFHYSRFDKTQPKLSKYATTNKNTYTKQYYDDSSSSDDSSDSTEQIYQKYSDLYSKSKLLSPQTHKKYDTESDTYSENSGSEEKIKSKDKKQTKRPIPKVSQKHKHEDDDSSDDEYKNLVKVIMSNRNKKYTELSDSDEESEPKQTRSKLTSFKKESSSDSSDEFRPLSPCLTSKRVIERLKKCRISDSDDTDFDSSSSAKQTRPKTSNIDINKYLQQLNSSNDNNSSDEEIKKKPQVKAPKKSNSKQTDDEFDMEIESFEKNISPIAYKSPSKNNDLPNVGKIPFSFTADDSSDIQESVKQTDQDIANLVDIDSIHDTPKRVKRRSSHNYSPSSPVLDSEPSDFDNVKKEKKEEKKPIQVKQSVSKSVDEEEASGEDEIDDQNVDDSSDLDLGIPQPRTKEWDEWLKKQIESIEDSEEEDEEGIPSKEKLSSPISGKSTSSKK
ncbi:hypothetical protein TVAG_193610 [Trichomonas vaginalis G3]|uniref:Uncharacterized protein n=1 Tax=Trichomonas vaginalis (strain ATCC PRA-98 / G3) TaxID=412133 RepID=A2EVL2_TRIV3|nr:hypothetical protein TVAGG3_0357920 [Trichomonas vaginalis G3]EAY03291.1 hypothetical protein TVAG_193610 [Trichomonas vaginalis G3]KAI5531745.1 hypothetical protein TVAGG3_0357920 [Trichomonas vaginalis G3]|eukprot:XP_001315514.1 hypothetical protein [Trichomonas vaginalis G3]